MFNPCSIRYDLEQRYHDLIALLSHLSETVFDLPDGGSKSFKTYARSFRTCVTESRKHNTEARHRHPSTRSRHRGRPRPVETLETLRRYCRHHGANLAFRAIFGIADDIGK